MKYMRTLYNIYICVCVCVVYKYIVTMKLFSYLFYFMYFLYFLYIMCMYVLFLEDFRAPMQGAFSGQQKGLTIFLGYR